MALSGSMEHSLAEADSSSINQVIYRFVLYEKAHCSIYIRPPLDPILSQLNPIYTLPLNSLISILLELVCVERWTFKRDT